MGNVLPAILIVIVCFPFAFNAQSLKPLPTEFVDCVTNQRGVPVASNKQQTPLIKSRSGIVAYAEITAQSSTIGQCQNSTTVYVGQGNGSFRRVLRQGVERISDGSIYDGNGVAYMSWSPSGRNLLVVLFQWIWGTDGDGNYKYFLIKAGDNAARLMFPERAIWEQFKHPCYAQISFNGWVDDERIQLETRPFINFDEEGKPDPTPSCIKEPTMFSFDVLTDAVSGSSANF
ncbi:MAG: hypothetical protein DMG63_15375 [Acidobacteria bacterium]|nr:MAG: hypothetical protein DMG63_15375 [Acidobacteriota bacterium]